MSQSVASKLLSDFEEINAAYQKIQSTLTDDEHAAVVKKVTDIVAAVTPSVAAAGSAGLIGAGDVAHVQAAVSEIAAAANTLSVWQKLVSFFKSLF